MIQTIIAPTIHRAKQLQKLETNELTRAITLEDFVVQKCSLSPSAFLNGVDMSIINVNCVVKNILFFIIKV